MASSNEREQIRISIPPLYTPFPPETPHPKAESLVEQGRAWISSFPFFGEELPRATIEAGRFGEASCLCWPTGSEETVRLSVDWALTLITMDDLVSDLGADSHNVPLVVDTLSRVARTLEYPESGVQDDANPFAAPWHDIARRFHQYATPAVHRRWVEGHRSLFSGAVWQQSVAQAGVLPSLNEYLSMRMQTIGVLASGAMTELTGGYEVPGREMDSPAVRAVNEAWSLIMACDNDLFSYGKELWQSRHGEADNLNLVSLCINRHGHTLDQALEQVAALRNRAMALLVQLSERLALTGSIELRTYLLQAGQVIRAGEDWQLDPRTRRYTSPHGSPPADIKFTADIVASPAAGTWTGGPLPTIDWWWDQLV
ncbi:terpene synthase family protein [Streptomyces sp. NBC_01615]|uniref:terpene synthase family protein n=1 Tax=Streptomyces sp. NBC_01615 TaxID=2975898 RepID=UPI00386916D9